MKILMENGINSAKALAMSRFKNICGLEGIGEATAKKTHLEPRSALGMSEFKTVSEFQENHEFIGTESLNFNAILGGGIETGFITEVYGPFKSGKTNLAHTPCVTTQVKNKSKFEKEIKIRDKSPLKLRFFIKYFSSKKK